MRMVIITMTMHNDVVHPNDAVQPCHRLDAQVVRVDLDDQAGHQAGEEVTIVRGK